MRWIQGRNFGGAVLFLLLAGLVQPALAQQSVNASAYDYDARDPGAVPARLRHFEGTVTVQRASAGETSDAIPNLPLEAGDRLWTGDRGRAELMLSDGSLIWAGERTTLDVVALDSGNGSGSIVRFWGGALIVYRPDVAPLAAVRVDGGDTVVVLDRPGLVRVDRDDEQRVWLSVYDGEATLNAGGLFETVRAGQQSYTEPGTAPSRAAAFSTASLDDFGSWQQDRWYAYAETTRHVAQREYIPASVRPYATELETGGSWFYYDDFGSYAWRPTVSVGWSPYNNGRWVWGYGGWTWVPRASWGWATAHYGRWHHLPAHGWVWFPGAVYRPAWVSWYVGYGHVGWSPIGYYNRPFISINLWFGGSWGYGHGYHGGRGYQYPNYYGSGGRAVGGQGYVRGDNDRGGWTLIDAADFGRGDPGRRAVPRNTLPADAGRSAVTLTGSLRQRNIDALGAGRRAVPAGRGTSITGATSGSRTALGRGATAPTLNGRPIATGPDSPGRTAIDRGARTGDTASRGTLGRPSVSARPSDGNRTAIGTRPGATTSPRPSIARRGTGTAGTRPPGTRGSLARPGADPRGGVGTRGVPRSAVTRPPAGGATGSRYVAPLPSTGNRPSIGSRPTAGNRPTTVGRPGMVRPGIGTPSTPGRPSVGVRPSPARPGSGRPSISYRPGGTSRPSGAVGGRPSIGGRPGGPSVGTSRPSAGGRPSMGAPRGGPSSSGRSAVSRGARGSVRRR